MTFPEEYIIQCRKTVEVQEYMNKNRNQIYPCFCYLSIINRTCIYTWKPTTLKGPIVDDNEFIFLSLQDGMDRKAIISINLKIDNIIWLPSQRQLQDLMGGIPLGFIKVLYNITYGDIEPELGYKYYAQFKSMEQIYLAWAMKNKFHKTWDRIKKDWVAE